jgi:hypothetical protein
LSLPISYDRKDDVFICQGSFCGWECIKAYNFYENTSGKEFRTSLISMMYQKTTTSVKKIAIAPPRQCLKIYGGKMTIEEFRKNNDTSYTFLPNMMIQNPPSIEKNVNFKWIDKDEASKKYNEQTMTSNDNQIKLKNKTVKEPKVRNSTLDRSLGIFPSPQ